MTFIRYLLGALGLMLLYLAFFITVDEQGKIANRLEQAWKRIQDLQAAAMSRQAAFCQAIAELFTAFLKSLFGSSLLSMRSLAVALVLCALPSIVFFLFEPAGILFKILLVLAIISLKLHFDVSRAWLFSKASFDVQAATCK
jgi:hypothetical protein